MTDRGAELAWKWIVRAFALLAAGYVLIGLHGNVPVGAYVLIGGILGLPNVFNGAGAIGDLLASRKGDDK